MLWIAESGRASRVSAGDDAETIALRALGWIAADGEMLARFLAAGGLSAADFRKLAARHAVDAVFLGSVLDFLLQEDAWITAFCDENDLGYDRPRRARAGLPGAGFDDW
jgi:hypothetical protein